MAHASNIFKRSKAMRNNHLNQNSFRPSIIKSEQDVHQPTEDSIAGQTPTVTPPPRPVANEDVDIVDPVTTSPVAIPTVNNTGDETVPSTSGLNHRPESTGSGFTGSPSKRRKSSESNPKSPQNPVRSVTPIEHIANPNSESPGTHLNFLNGVVVHAFD